MKMVLGDSGHSLRALHLFVSTFVGAFICRSAFQAGKYSLLLYVLGLAFRDPDDKILQRTHDRHVVPEQRAPPMSLSLEVSSSPSKLVHGALKGFPKLLCRQGFLLRLAFKGPILLTLPNRGPTEHSEVALAPLLVSCLVCSTDGAYRRTLKGVCVILSTMSLGGFLQALQVFLRIGNEFSNGLQASDFHLFWNLESLESRLRYHSPSERSN